MVYYCIICSLFWYWFIVYSVAMLNIFLILYFALKVIFMKFLIQFLNYLLLVIRNIIVSSFNILNLFIDSSSCFIYLGFLHSSLHCFWIGQIFLPLPNIFTSKMGDVGSIPGLGRSLEEGSYPLQYSDLEYSMNRGAWQATVHGVAKSQTRLVVSFSLSPKL